MQGKWPSHGLNYAWQSESDNAAQEDPSRERGEEERPQQRRLPRYKFSHGTADLAVPVQQPSPAWPAILDGSDVQGPLGKGIHSGPQISGAANSSALGAGPAGRGCVIICEAPNATCRVPGSVLSTRTTILWGCHGHVLPEGHTTGEWHDLGSNPALPSSKARLLSIMAYGLHLGPFTPTNPLSLGTQEPKVLAK